MKTTPSANYISALLAKHKCDEIQHHIGKNVLILTVLLHVATEYDNPDKKEIDTQS